MAKQQMQQTITFNGNSFDTAHTPGVKIIKPTIMFDKYSWRLYCYGSEADVINTRNKMATLGLDPNQAVLLTFDYSDEIAAKGIALLFSMMLAYPQFLKEWHDKIFK